MRHIMKILSPVDSTEEVEALVSAGASEFYCGLLEEQWYSRYPVISINRRPAGKGHFRDFKELKRMVQRAHSFDVPVYFTLNEHYYINAQYGLVQQYVESALEAGVDAFIVSDFGLMAFIKEKNYQVPLHISTGGTVFNWRSAMFYKTLGAVSITLPRHLSLDEMRAISAKTEGLEKTVFVLNSRCINVDGLCTFQHGLAGKKIFPMFRNACMLPYEINLFVNDPEINLSPARQASIIARQKIWETVHLDDHPCGACALYELNEMGISSIKVVGRGNPTERKQGDILFLKRLIDYLKDNPEKVVFRKTARELYAEKYNRACRTHMCYYPSVMSDEES